MEGGAQRVGSFQGENVRVEGLSDFVVGRDVRGALQEQPLVVHLVERHVFQFVEEWSQIKGRSSAGGNAHLNRRKSRIGGHGEFQLCREVERCQPHPNWGIFMGADDLRGHKPKLVVDLAPHTSRRPNQHHQHSHKISHGRQYKPWINARPEVKRHTSRNTGCSEKAFQRPPLTSGMSTRWLPVATDRSLSAPTRLQSAPS